MLENDLETACLTWLSDLGYTCLTGDDVSAGGEHEARQKYLDVVLEPRLRESLDRLNPSLPSSAVEEAYNKLATYGAQSLAEGNREIYGWLRNGIPVEVEDGDGHKSTVLATAFDLEDEDNNDFLAVQQFTVHGEKIRRPDIVLFVNGIPLAVLELKNPADINADVESAYNQIQTYKNDISQLFTYNLLNVVSDGTVARYGSLTAEYGHYSHWRLIDDEKAPEGMLELEVLIRGLLAPKTLLRFFKGFVLFMSQDGAPSIKIIAQWHQYHGVLKAVDRALDAYLHKK
ncbi:MAG: type I restriction endonuclease subunit R, partial [gamma proteobacterium symbiont of Clathrolucina costata]